MLLLILLDASTIIVESHERVVDSSVSSCVLLMRHPQPSHRGGHPCAVDVLLGPTGVMPHPG